MGIENEYFLSKMLAEKNLQILQLQAQIVSISAGTSPDAQEKSPSGDSSSPVQGGHGGPCA